MMSEQSRLPQWTRRIEQKFDHISQLPIAIQAQSQLQTAMHIGSTGAVTNLPCGPAQYAAVAARVKPLEMLHRSERIALRGVASCKSMMTEESR